MVRFSPANTKIKALSEVKALQPFLKNRKVYSFDLLSGHSCPYAKQCLSKVVTIGDKNKIVDGKDTEFRCFSASQEAVYTSVYNLRKANFDELRVLSLAGMVDAIQAGMPKNLGICRLHVGGEFFSPVYFQAWLQVVANNPDRLFYAYTKSLPYWVNNIYQVGMLENLVLTASYGGRRDDMIETYGLRSANVVNHPSETSLEIDHTDSHAANPETRDIDFSLLIHGIQPKGSKASAGIKRMKSEKVQYAYSR